MLFFLLFSISPAFAQTCPPATVTITASSVLYCYNTTPSFTATAANAGTAPTYLWKKNGIALSGHNQPNEIIPVNVGDVITCEAAGTNACGNPVAVTSNSLTIQSNPGYNQGPEVTIAATQERICAGTTVTFTATNVSESATPVYQWLVNGTPVGNNNATFVSNTLANGDKVECRMTVPHCNGSGSTKDYSNAIVMTVNSQQNLTVSISPVAAAICKGVSLTFTAKAENAGASPTYQWNVNNLPVGGNSNTFTSTTLNNNDQVTCQITIDPAVASCTNGTAAVSNAVTLSVQDAFTPTVKITASQEEICEGTTVSFTAAGTDTGPRPTYQWQVNGTNVGTNGPQFSTDNLANGDKVSCTLIPVSSCGSVATSDVLTMTVHPNPVVQFATSSVVMEPGKQFQLTPRVQGVISSHQWSPAAMLVDPSSLAPTTTPLYANVTYNLWVKTAAGCQDTASFTIITYGKLYMPNSFTPNGDGKNDVFRLPPGIPVTLKEFSVYDRWGGLVFTTTDKSKGWDGKQKGTSAAAGTYIYLIRGEDVKGQILLKGTVQLIR